MRSDGVRGVGVAARYCPAVDRTRALRAAKLEPKADARRTEDVPRGAAGQGARLQHRSKADRTGRLILGNVCVEELRGEQRHGVLSKEFAER